LDIYERQAPIRLARVNKIMVVGLGGTGSWVALLSAMTGAVSLTLVDNDVIELTNLNRMPLPITSIGKPKAEAIKEEILRLRPDASVIALNIEVSEFLIGSVAPNILVDCTDKIKVHKEIYKYCRAMGLIYVRCCYDGLHITVSSSLPGFNTVHGEDAEGGYTITPSWVAPAIIAAGYAVAKIFKNIGIEYSGDITHPISEMDVINNGFINGVLTKDIAGRKELP
jgi:molybdopterin/thiamine biosynthesis adenylyltransferase